MICDISAHRHILPCHRHRPLALIKTDLQRKKNGEKPLHFDDFVILILTFFITLLQLVQTWDL